VSEPVAPRPPGAAAPVPLQAGPLGRWLAPTSESRIERIACHDIDNRIWPPAATQDELMVALRRSVGVRGIVEPLLLRPTGGRFQVVLGARRLVAALEAGLTEVPAIVRELDDAEATLLAAWSVAPGSDPGQAVELAARLCAAGVGEAEAAALLTAMGAAPAAPTIPAPRRWSLVGGAGRLRFAGAETPVRVLLDGLGERRSASLAALRGVDPERLT
jgi:hypothetical protein